MRYHQSLLLLLLLLVVATYAASSAATKPFLSTHRTSHHALHRTKSAHLSSHHVAHEKTTVSATSKNVQGTPDDCALRQFTASAAASIQTTPNSSSDWGALSYSALRIGPLCNASLEETVQRSHAFEPISRTPHSIDAASCDVSYFVATDGSDSNPGTLEAPFATLLYALSVSRNRAGGVSNPCIYLRAGTYYLGATPPSTVGSPLESQFGYIDLQPIDSGLTIAAYPGEQVVLSGGVEVEVSWTPYKTLPAGTVYYATLPKGLLTDSLHLNELFIEGTRAIRAKWPNGDPSTHGMYSSPSGFDTSGEVGWIAPLSPPAATEVHVSDPTNPRQHFSQYQMGYEGVATVFDPPRSFWALANPPGGGGSTYVVPRGVNYSDSELAARVANWSNPSTGFLHAFHQYYWGNWIFEIEGVDKSSTSVLFGAGGFQEARGANAGSAYYVEFILEELDDPNEWFYEEATGRLYYMVNQTAPQTVILSQLPCLISVHGSAALPVSNVVISGLTFSHTSNTMMRKFEVPSGGDWSVHRGGAVFVTGSENLVIQDSVFSYIGGSGVVISNWNLAATVTTSEFVWGLDSGIIILGTFAGIDGIAFQEQPTLTSITHNLFHELGIVVKQSAPILVSLARSTTISRNLIFNVPRAGVNINDGFFGNQTLFGNVMFNTVRETADHGPINSWDRLPFLTLQWDDSTSDYAPSLNPSTNIITRNLLFNSYTSVWPIDHDDGSRLYDDSYNVLVYGGYKNYLGNSKTARNSLYIYPDGTRYDAVHPALASRAASSTLNKYGGWGSNCLQSFYPEANISGWNEHWYNNTCILQQTAQPYQLDACQIGSLTDMIPYLSNNQLYFPSGTSAQISCNLANGTSTTLSLADLQKQGYDIGTTQGTNPGIDKILSWATSIFYSS